jgi:hypothetical protein
MRARRFKQLLCIACLVLFARATTASADGFPVGLVPDLWRNLRETQQVAVISLGMEAI